MIKMLMSFSPTKRNLLMIKAPYHEELERGELSLDELTVRALYAGMNDEVDDDDDDNGGIRIVSRKSQKNQGEPSILACSLGQVTTISTGWPQLARLSTIPSIEWRLADGK
jgi:hypothetical protein